MLNEKDIINGKRYKFRTDYSDYVAMDVGNCEITIIRPLEDGKEIDKADVGPMWLAVTDDGLNLNVYLDEQVKKWI